MKIAPTPLVLAATIYLEAFHFIDMPYVKRVRACNPEGIYAFLQEYEVMRFGLKNPLPKALSEHEKKKRILEPVLPRGVSRADMFRNRIFDLALHVVDGRFDSELTNYCVRYFNPSEGITMESLLSARALIS